MISYAHEMALWKLAFWMIVFLSIGVLAWLLIDVIQNWRRQKNKRGEND